MTGLLAAVKANVASSCLAEGMKKEGCSVSLKGISRSRLIIDFDKPGAPLSSHQTRCDYLFVAELANVPDGIRAIELKRGGFEANLVRQQLQVGAGVAERLIPGSFDVRFLPVLASGNVPKGQRKYMRFSVRFRGSDTPLRRIRSGDPLP